MDGLLLERNGKPPRKEVMTIEYNERYVAALDVGTTSVRCQILNSKAESVSTASSNINLIYPQCGFVEICPDELWESVCHVIKEAIYSANLEASQITGLGISTQRGTFTTWRRDNGKHFHNFITWKDLRSDNLVTKWNSSFFMKGFKIACYSLYLVTRNRRYLAGSSLKIANTQTTLRLVWVLENIPEVKEQLTKNNVMFGTIDSWLVYKLIPNQTHVIDITNASATGFFDPFVLDWASWSNLILGIPFNIMPKVVQNDYSFGSVDKNLFGHPIPLLCVISDQSASMFGSGCFKRGDAKLTLGTGSFLDINSNNKAHGSAAGLYPLVGWNLNNKITYIIEGACNDTGSLIQWALNAGVISNPSETSTLANELENNDGVYFIPAFSGLGPPIMDDNAASGFIGLKPTSTKQHMVRAMLESIVFRIALLYFMVTKETSYKIKKICVDGGVSNNDFICQQLANTLGIEIERPSTTEMTTFGVAFITGLKSGIWKSADDLLKLRVSCKVFLPNEDKKVQERNEHDFNTWLKAVDRFKSWYAVS